MGCMTPIQRFLAALLASVTALSPYQMSARAQTPGAETTVVDQLVAEYIAAQGGLETIRAVQSVRTTGEVAIPSQGMVLPITIVQARPNRMRVEIAIPDMAVDIVNGFDGETAWETNPLQGGTRELTGEPARNFREQADLDGVLIDYAAKGYAVTHAGAGEVSGAPTQTLRVRRPPPDTTEIVVHLDAASHLQIKAEGWGTHPVTGARVKVETFMTDYRDVGGIKVPFAIEVTMDGQPFQVITVHDVTLNVPVEQGLFTIPTTTLVE